MSEAVLDEQTQPKSEPPKDDGAAHRSSRVRRQRSAMLEIVNVKSTDSGSVEAIINYKGTSTPIRARHRDRRAALRALLPNEVAEGVITVLDGGDVSDPDGLTNALLHAVGDTHRGSPSA